MSDKTLKEQVEERQREAGQGTPINITDLVMSNAVVPPGFSMRMVTFKEANKMAEEMHIGHLRSSASEGFNLTAGQLERFAAWDEEQNVEIRNSNAGKLSVGASGGQVTFEFTPTGMGTLTIARNTLTKKSIDLTEY